LIDGPDYHRGARDLASLARAAPGTIQHVAGHLSYGIHESFAAPCLYYTVLREPVDRLVSLYYFIRTARDHPRHAPVSDMSLEEFALSGLNPEIENCQTKMLSGRPESNFIDGPETCSEVDFERGVAHMEADWMMAGLFEDLQGSVFLLCKRMGWPQQVLGRRNVTKKRAPRVRLSAREIEAIRSVNQFDLRLYEHARKRHQLVLAELSLGDRLRVRRLRWRARQ